MPDENKVQFNLKNVHYAVLTDADAMTYSEPVSVPGAVNLNLDPQSELSKFYADGMVYYQAVANNGYSGDLEMARFIDQMMKDVWGFQESTDKVLVERGDVEAKAFALLFQIDGDADGELYALFNCSGTKPKIAAATNTETKTPQTQTSTISAVPLPNGYIMARTTKDTAAETKGNWFKAVHKPTFETAAAAQEE